MGMIFALATSFNGDLSKWDTSQVTNVEGIFYGATSFNGDLAKWDTRKATNMGLMFEGATSFKGDLSKWDTRSLSVEAKEAWVEENSKHGAKFKGPDEL